MAISKVTVSYHDWYIQQTINQLSDGTSGEEQIQKLKIPTQSHYTVTLLYSTNVKDTQLATILLTQDTATPKWLL